MFKILSLLLTFALATSFSYSEAGGGKNGDVDGEIARELHRRSKLKEKWHKKELVTDEYFGRIYAPTVVGCKKGISEYKKVVAKLKSRLQKVKTKKSRDKYAKGIQLYTEYIDLLVAAVKAVEEEKNYNKLCSEIFPAIKEQETTISRVLGSRVKRSWLMTSELYPTTKDKKKNSSQKRSEKKTKSSKSK